MYFIDQRSHLQGSYWAVDNSPIDDQFRKRRRNPYSPEHSFSSTSSLGSPAFSLHGSAPGSQIILHGSHPGSDMVCIPLHALTFIHCRYVWIGDKVILSCNSVIIVLTHDLVTKVVHTLASNRVVEQMAMRNYGVMPILPVVRLQCRYNTIYHKL